MSRQQFNNRLERLFSDPDPRAPSWQSDSEYSLAGWTWECDHQGNFISCSPEVEEVLGYRPEGLIGQPLTSFGLHPESSSALHAALNQEELPINLDVQYQTRDGVLIPVSLHIFDISTGDRIRLGGFAQAVFVHSSGSSPDQRDLRKMKALSGATPWNPNQVQPFKKGRDIEAVIDEEDKRNGKDGKRHQERIEQPLDESKIGDHILANEKVKEILDDFRMDSIEIKESGSSQVISFQKEELREDRSQKPVVTGSLRGKEIRSYPKVVVQEFEQRLEWGNKLKLTPDEENFITTYKYSPAGISGLIRRQLAPKEILKHDKFWIAVRIEVINGKSKRIWVNCKEEQKEAERIDLDEFLQNPKMLFPILNQAVKFPGRSKVTLRIGEDYWIPR